MADKASIAVQTDVITMARGVLDQLELAPSFDTPGLNLPSGCLDKLALPKKADVNIISQSELDSEGKITSTIEGHGVNAPPFELSFIGKKSRLNVKQMRSEAQNYARLNSKKCKIFAGVVVKEIADSEKILDRHEERVVSYVSEDGRAVTWRQENTDPRKLSSVPHLSEGQVTILELLTDPDK